MPSRGSNFARFWTRFAGGVLVASIAAGGVCAAKGSSRDGPNSLAEWHIGPVRYLMSRTETRQFRRLDTDLERMQFIRRFWERRDPDPRTPENEARLAFWQRVAEANRQFADTPLPGWKTDRGKIYVLLGPPNDVERNLEFDTKERTAHGRGLLRWHYSGLQRAASRAMTVIAFVHTGDGDWRLTTDPKLTSMFLNINAGQPNTLPSYLEQLVRDIPWSTGSLGTAMDLGRLQEVPSEGELMRAAVRSEEFLGSFQGLGIVHERVSGSGARLHAITVAVPRAELTPAWDGSAAGVAQRFAVSAAVRPTGEGSAERITIDIPEDAWVAEPAPGDDDPWLRFQAIRQIPPGAWRLTAVILDRQGRASATVFSDVDVAPPEPGAALFDGPVLARLLLPSGDAPELQTRPFKMRDLVVVPRMEALLRADEPFRLYVEAHAPAGVDAPVELSWTISRLEAGAAEPLEETSGRLEDGRGPRAWDFEGGRLPPGRYRVSFTALGDGVRPASRSIDFEIRAPSEGAGPS